ncbi:MAG: NUDIX hydrolase [Burkholderiales bacterium]|nr:NUDIX hydrolase [Sulfuricellaceae bacterium]
MNYCSHCGVPLSYRVPAGDTLPRHVCDACNTIHYQNPKIVVGCIPEWDGKILLCRRAIEPKHGLWTIPAGFMENGETTAQGAQRETLEEACAEVEIGQLYALYNLPHISQVYLIFLARMKEKAYAPGVESLEVRLFDLADIPWQELAFQAVRHSLEHFVNDRRDGLFRFHSGDVAPQADDDKDKHRPIVSQPGLATG